MTKFPAAELVWHLHIIGESFRNFGSSIVASERWHPDTKFKCREMGRASGFSACAVMIDEAISRLDRDISVPRKGK